MKRRQPCKERKKEPQAEGTGVHGTYGENGGHSRKGRGRGQEMRSWLDRGSKMQSFLSQDKKLEFYPKFHQKPLKNFIQESDRI